MVHWRRNLVFVWLSQFLTLTGFNLGMPFVAFYMQTELGVSEEMAKIYNGWFTAAAALPLALMGPIWGILADRYGRKPMMLRATMSMIAVLVGMGLARSVAMLLTLRFLQGMMTGTISAAVALVASTTPTHRQGFALGALNSAVFTGLLTGNFVGGLLADAFGYRVPFFIGAGIVLLAVLFIFFPVREQFDPEERKRQDDARQPGERRAAVRAVYPLLVLICVLAAARTFEAPIVPFFVQQLNGGIEGASGITGVLNATAAVGALLSGFLLGHLSDRSSAARVGLWAAVGAGVCFLVVGRAQGFPLLFASRFCAYVCAGGLGSVFNAWLSRLTPEPRRGLVFGVQVTASAMGWSVSPLLFGYLYSATDLATVYLVGPMLFVVLVITILWARAKLTDTTVAAAEAESLPFGDSRRES